MCLCVDVLKPKQKKNCQHRLISSSISSHKTIWVLLPFARWCLNMIISTTQQNTNYHRTCHSFHHEQLRVVCCLPHFFFSLFLSLLLPLDVSICCLFARYIFDLYTPIGFVCVKWQCFVAGIHNNFLFIVFFYWTKTTIICYSWRRSYWYWMIWNYHKTHAAMVDVSIFNNRFTAVFFSLAFSFFLIIILFRYTHQRWQFFFLSL